MSPASGEKKPKGRVKKEKPEKTEKTDKPDKEGLKQTKLTFKKEPKKVSSCIGIVESKYPTQESERPVTRYELRHASYTLTVYCNILML